MKILITGGAGFVGSRLATLFQESGDEVHVLDNLKRRGSELNLPVFKRRGISFFHGDIRNPSDLNDLPSNYDLLLEASAEPSVHAGTKGSASYLLDTNLVGSIHCLNFARERAGGMVFLSTSRVYSLHDLQTIPLEEHESRFLHKPQPEKGLSEKGIQESFSTQTARSLYGASKLCSEILLQEYVNSYGYNAIINRCGVIAGAGQFGKVDQGVFTLWIANHYFQKPLQYTGFGGTGLQVRDLLHPQDLFELIQKQAENLATHKGETFNVGGGLEISTSLREWTQLAERYTGNTVEINSNPETAPVDVPYYITDATKAEQAFDWRPKIQAKEIAQEITHWIKSNEASLKFIFG